MTISDPIIYLQQVGLKSLGFDPGPLDGDIGPKTRATINAWKKTFTTQKIKDHLIYLQQVGLKSLGFDPGPLDGDIGPKTRAGFDAWQLSFNKISDTAISLVKLATTQVGIRETSYNNGPGIEKFWPPTSYKDGYKNREPYCAAFLCWLIATAIGSLEHTFSKPTSPVAYDMEKWGKANEGKGVHVLNKNKEPAKPGDVFTLATASHCGLIVSIPRNGSVETIEANTNEAGSREGDGVYLKSRSLASIRTIIRIV